MDRRCRGCGRTTRRTLCSSCRSIYEDPQERSSRTHSRSAGYGSEDYYDRGYQASSDHTRRDRDQYPRYEEDISHGYRHVPGTTDSRYQASYPPRYEEDISHGYRHVPGTTDSRYQAEYHDDRREAQDRDRDGSVRYRRGGRGYPREDDRNERRQNIREDYWAPPEVPDPPIHDYDHYDDTPSYDYEEASRGVDEALRRQRQERRSTFDHGYDQDYRSPSSEGQRRD